MKRTRSDQMPQGGIALALIVLGGLSLFTANLLAEAAGGEGGACNDPAPGGCGFNSCAPDQNRTVQVCGDTTLMLSSCSHNEACCLYDYNGLGCQVGGCAMGYMRKRRTSSVSGCAATSEYCEYNSSCPQPCSGCSATCAPTTCGQTLSGTNSCGDPCTVTCSPCGASVTWQRYGFAVPDHPTYGFGLPSNATKDLVGLAAKGNIIVGDYTPYPGNPSDSLDFRTRVVPKLKPYDEDENPDGVTQPYLVDPTDRDLGYDNASANKCRSSGNKPCFDGDYDQRDKENNNPAFKLNPDGSPGKSEIRKFYESSLADDNFRALVHPNLRDQNGLYTDQDLDTPLVIDAALFTNHALAGNVKAKHLVINGTMVARDDALVFNRTLTINHDVRLAGDGASVTVALPSSIGRPVLLRRQECKPESCSP